MISKKKAAEALRLSGFYALILGLLQITLVLPFLFRGFEQLTFENLLLFLYTYLSTGATMIFIGWLIMACARGLKTSESWPIPIAFGAGIFLFILGIGAIVSMTFNPLVYLILLSALIELISLQVYRHADSSI